VSATSALATGNYDTKKDHRATKPKYDPPQHDGPTMVKYKADGIAEKFCRQLKGRKRNIIRFHDRAPTIRFMLLP
jgi:hypothetical protein